MAYTSWDDDAVASQAGTVNTSLDGLNVAENCAAGNMNAAIRMLMANIKALADSTNTTGLMPKTGGTFTGDVLRDGRGAFLHHAGSTYASGRVFVTASGASDPTSAVGDIWIELA